MVVDSKVIEDLETLQKEINKHIDTLSKEIKSINQSSYIYQWIFSSNVTTKLHKQQYYLRPIERGLINVTEVIKSLKSQGSTKARLTNASQYYKILIYAKKVTTDIAYKDRIITDDYSSTYPNSMNQSISYAKDRGRTGKIISKCLDVINRLFENIKNHFEDLLNEYVTNSIPHIRSLNLQENKDKLFKEIKVDVFRISGVTDNQLLEAILEKAFNSCIDNEKRSTSDIPEDYELKVITPS